MSSETAPFSSPGEDARSLEDGEESVASEDDAFLPWFVRPQHDTLFATGRGIDGPLVIIGKHTEEEGDKTVPYIALAKRKGSLGAETTRITFEMRLDGDETQNEYELSVKVRVKGEAPLRVILLSKETGVVLGELKHAFYMNGVSDAFFWQTFSTLVAFDDPNTLVSFEMHTDLELCAFCFERVRPATPEIVDPEEKWRKPPKLAKRGIRSMPVNRRPWLVPDPRSEGMTLLERRKEDKARRRYVLHGKRGGDGLPGSFVSEEAEEARHLPTAFDDRFDVERRVAEFKSTEEEEGVVQLARVNNTFNSNPIRHEASFKDQVQMAAFDLLSERYSISVKGSRR